MQRYLTEEQQYNVQNDQKILALYIGSVQCEGFVRGNRAGYGMRKFYEVELSADLYIPWFDNGYSPRYKKGEMIEIERKDVVAYI